MRFVKSMYSSFDNSALGLKLSKNDIIVVTSEIENSEVFQTGVATRNFVPVHIGNMVQFEKVKNITDDLRAEFKAIIAPKPPEIVEEIPVEISVEVPDYVKGEENKSEFIVPENLDDFKYKALQKFALKVEKFYKVEINRSAKKANLLAEIKAVLKIE